MVQDIHERKNDKRPLRPHGMRNRQAGVAYKRVTVKDDVAVQCPVAGIGGFFEFPVPPAELFNLVTGVEKIMRRKGSLAYENGVEKVAGKILADRGRFVDAADRDDLDIRDFAEAVKTALEEGQTIGDVGSQGDS
jgi:hypothetical protein